MTTRRLDALLSVKFWRMITTAILALIVIIAFLQPVSGDSDLKSQTPRVAMGSVIFLIAMVLVPWLLKPIRVASQRALPWITALVSGGIVLAGVLLNLLGREGAASALFQGIHVVTGSSNFGDIRLPLAWRACWADGSDVFSDVNCVQGIITPAPEHVMDYGPGWLWLASLTPSQAMAPLLGVGMLVLTSVSIWWLSRQSLGRGQIALLIGSLGASWLLLLERANLDAVILWGAVLFAIALQRTSALWPWVLAASGVWVLGTWKYYPFVLGLALIPVIRHRRGWIVLGAFILAAGTYSLLAFDRVLQAQIDNADRSAQIGTGLGRDLVARLLSGSASAPTWALALATLLAVAAGVWGFASTRSVSKTPSLSLTVIAVTGSLMMAIPLVLSGFAHQYKIALLVLAVPLLSRLSHKGQPEVWQSSTFVLIASTVALVGLWGNPFTWSLTILIAAGFSLGAAIQPLIHWSMPKRKAHSYLQAAQGT